MALPRGLHSAERIARHRAEGSWSGETVDQLFRHQVETRGEQLAVVDPANRAALLGSPPRRLTWAQLSELVTYLRDRKFASYKLPERLEVRDQLPRNPLGKVLKRELRRSIST